MKNEHGQKLSRRLHPASPVLNLGKWFSWFIIPGLLVLFLGGGFGWEVWLMGFFVFAIGYEIFRYITFRYEMAADEIIVRQGLIFRSERHIPFARIQNIDLVQNALHRLCGVAIVRLETAGGAKPEAVLSVLHLDAVKIMRQRVFAGRFSSDGNEQIDPGDQSNVVIRIPTSDLVRLGLVNNRGWALIAILLGIAWEFDLWEYINVIKLFNIDPSQWSVLAIILTSALGAVVMMVLLYLFSIIWTILRLHGYTLRRMGEDLQLQCGLLTRRSATIPRHRIQLISIHESIMHRLFGCVTIRVETAAGQDSSDVEGQSSLSQKWFVPIVPSAQVPRILEELQPGLTIPPESRWEPMSPTGRRRFIKKLLIITLLIVVLFGVIWRPWGLLVGVVLIPLVWWHGRRAIRHFGWAEVDGRILFRSGAWTKRLSMVFDETSQVVWMTHSPFDRRHKQARLHIDTAGAGPAGHRISIPYLDVSLVRNKLRQSLHRQETADMRS